MTPSTYCCLWTIGARNRSKTTSRRHSDKHRSSLRPLRWRQRNGAKRRPLRRPSGRASTVSLPAQHVHPRERTTITASPSFPRTAPLVGTCHLGLGEPRARDLPGLVPPTIPISRKASQAPEAVAETQDCLRGPEQWRPVPVLLRCRLD